MEERRWLAMDDNNTILFKVKPNWSGKGWSRQFSQEYIDDSPSFIKSGQLWESVLWINGMPLGLQPGHHFWRNSSWKMIEQNN